MRIEQLHDLFNEAQQAATLGRYTPAAIAYGRAASAVESGSLDTALGDRSQVLRSIRFNLAQVLNHLGQYQLALTSADAGLDLAPTPLGRAIGLAAKGEALCGLGRCNDGIDAFAEAVAAHPIVGRLNSADSMTRVYAKDLLPTASRLVDEVEDEQLSAEQREEVRTIRRAIAERLN